MKAKTFLITGGAGFLGINLTRYLVNKGHKVVIIDVVDFDYPDMVKKVKAIKGDIRDYNLVKKAAKNVDFIVHTAAALPLYKKEDIYSTDVNGTKNVLRAAKEQKVKRVIHISSTAVYGPHDHYPIYENDKIEGVGHYGNAKILAEKACLEYREKGLCVTIIRPKSFVGPERLGVFAVLYDWINDRRNVPIVGKGENKYQLLDVEDLCDAIHLCTTKNKEAVNDTFNIGAKEFTTMKEDFGAVLEYAKYGKKIIPLPATPIIWTLKVFEKLNMSPLYKWVYETAYKDSVVSVEKAEKKLGFTPKYSNKQALIRSYQWYVNHYKEYGKKTGITHRVPWKQGILSIAKLFF